MATPQKDITKETIYIDVDDEITAIIDKLQNSTARIVAVVLPKRASVLQSVVNMKLLKRSAENAKKHIVLITSEAGLLPVAGVVGLHVARSLQSKPAIPVAPDTIPREQVIDEETGEEFEDFNPDAVADKPIGQLARSGGGAAAAAGTYAEPETIELDNDEPAAPAAASAAAAAGAATAAKKGKNKKLKVPNFNRFRLVLVLGILVLILLIGGFIYGNTALAKATVTIKTNSSDVATKANLTLDPKADQLDLETGTVPAKIESKSQTGSQQVSTSGQKNNGTKASGSVTLSLNDCSTDQVSIPAGTGVSSGGQTFITQSSASLQSVKIGGTCKNSSFTNVSSQDVSVVAQSAGAAYNVAASKFAVAGFSNVSGQSTDPMTGGTDNIVKIVTQADIDSAKQKISGADSGSVKDTLSKKLQSDGDFAITGSLHASDPVVTPSAAVGDQADTVTVTQATTYTMYGAKDADLKNVIATSVSKQIDSSKQKILQDGFNAAKYQIPTGTSSGPLQLTMTATSLAGPNLQLDKLAAQLGGKKTGDVQSSLKSIPGVTDVSVSYSPFWISTVPKKPSKVKIVIVKASGGSSSVNAGYGGNKP